MKISDMNQTELEYFSFLCKKFEVQVSSTEKFRELIKTSRENLEQQLKEVQKQFEEGKKYINEVEKMISNLEKGGLRK